MRLLHFLGNVILIGVIFHLTNLELFSFEWWLLFTGLVLFAINNHADGRWTETRRTE